METLPFQPLINGNYAALGDRFRPVSADFAQEVGPRLLPVRGKVPPISEALTSTWTIRMEIPVAVVVYMIRDDGHRLITGKIPGGSPSSPSSKKIGAPNSGKFTYVVVEATSGAFVTGFNAMAGDEVTISASSLRPVNNPGLPWNAGELPTPARSGRPLPADSPPVLVASGVVKGGIILARTQHWQRSEDSYSLPGCASLLVTLTQTSGVTQSTSTMETLATSVGLDASVGWGPISASMSASLSRSSTTSQEVSISESTEATVVREFANPYNSPMVVFLWQLVDRVLVIGPDLELKAMIESVLLPEIPMAYDSAGNPFPPQGAVLCKPVSSPPADVGAR